jgi:hypothetical protein
MSDHPPSIRRRIPTKELNLTTPDTEPDSNTRPTRRSTKQSKNSNENKDPVDVNVNVLVKNLNNEDNDETSSKLKDKQKFRKTITDNERHTQSDTEQIITEKQKKRRRPKRISRTTQTYECVFRRMENEQHEELRPTSDLDKNIQTKKSLLRPRKKSPKRRYPIYLSTDAFKFVDSYFLFYLFNFFLCSLELKKFYRNNFLILNEIQQKHQLLLEVIHHKLVNY